ncbi:hypothetical protein [Gluconacetobacter tumulicola]|uniref:Uncharacterized protein n=1 Tax=Gluconacetobacter tumulicola TaxID=1017177 RepID=A0A7W4JB92_9PROT|nr:hypothetical protein [Gluconacetobacter tumulicola]MBB2178089.1 hypothetical protein [Gluconacetobacter tumulicola]
MFQAVFRKTAFCALGAGLFLLAATPHSAQAHVVTNDEARRLTLDALTAIPMPVRHVAYHRDTRAMHVASISDLHSARATVRSRGLVHNVVYHPHAVASARHTARKGRHRT